MQANNESISVSAEEAKSLSRGGERLPDSASPAQITALLGLEAERKNENKRGELSAWGGRAKLWRFACARWRALADAANPAPASTLIIEGSARGALEAGWFERALDLPAGSRAARIVLVQEPLKEPGVFCPQQALDLLSEIHKKSPDQKALLRAAVEKDALSAAALMRAAASQCFDDWPDLAQLRVGAVSEAGAEEWLARALTLSQSVCGGPSELSRWAIFMAAQWARQEPEAATLRVQRALAWACERWPWLHAVKKSAKSELSQEEKNFALLAKRARAVAQASGAALPPRALGALAAIDEREAADKRQKNQKKKSASTASQTPCLEPATLLARQGMLLSALRACDEPALEWLTGPGGLRAENLLFVVKRSGPLDMIAAAGMRGRDARAAQKTQTLLSILESAGFDLVQEPKKAASPRRVNPFLRGFELCAKADSSSEKSCAILAMAQARGCEKSGLSPQDASEWLAEAVAATQKSAWPDCGRHYFQAARAALDKWQIAGTLLEKTDEDGEAKGRGSRRAARL